MCEENNPNIRNAAVNIYRNVILISIVALWAIFGKNLNYLSIPLLFFFVWFKFVESEYLFYAGLAFLPVVTIGVINPGFHLQLSQLFLFSAILSALFIDKFKFAPVVCRFDVRILIFILVLVLSSFQSIYLPSDPVVILGAFRNYPWIKSLSRIILICALVMLAFFIRAYFSNADLLKKVIKVLFFSSIVYSLIGIVGFILFFFSYFDIFGISVVTYSMDELQRIRVFEYEPLFFGNYLLTITPIMFSLLFSNKGKIINSKLLFFLSVINLVAMILTFSRGAWAGLLAVFSFFIFINFNLIIVYFSKSVIFRNRRVLFILLLAIVAGLFFLVQSDFFYNYFIYPVQGAVDSNSGKFWSTKLRLMTLEIALSAFLSHPFFGIGFENFSFYAGNIFISTLVDSVINYPDVGSLPVKILAELGIFGFMVVAYLLMLSFRDVLRRIKQTKDVWLNPLIKGCAGSAVGIMVQFLFFSNVYLLHLWVLLGLILALYNFSEKSIN